MTARRTALAIAATTVVAAVAGWRWLVSLLELIDALDDDPPSPRRHL